jgi:SAM-dependent methyltransferase
LPVAWVQGNMREISWQEAFDGAFCFGNSFGYDDDAGNAAFLSAVWRSLKPGARFVLDYPTVLEARLPRFHERSWFQVGRIFFLESDRYDHVGGRTETEYTFIRDGAVVNRRGTHRNYTFREVCGMLGEAGFRDVEAYGSLNKEAFTLGSEGLVLVGRKRG